VSEEKRTHDEAAILYNVFAGDHMNRREVIDIGARLGWTSKTINLATNGRVHCVDPHFRLRKRVRRFVDNTGFPEDWLLGLTAAQYFQQCESEREQFSGFVIDGNHDYPEPLNDAKGAEAIAANDCIIMFHDLWGGPIQDAVRYLSEQGWSVQIYYTPNGVACCWRGFYGWRPPQHTPDPAIDWSGRQSEIRDMWRAK
jgi:hypothetical protein